MIQAELCKPGLHNLDIKMAIVQVGAKGYHFGMDKLKVTPKDFFLWAGAMLTLYVSVFAYIALIFDYLNYAFPDTLTYYSGDPYSSGMSYEMAILIVLLPLFLVLMRIIRSAISHDESRADIWVRRWALYLTLFIAGATVAADLVTVIMYFLNGDVTLRFVLKIFVVLLVAGAGFLHFLADLHGFWRANPRKALTISVAVGVLVFLTILSGFAIVGTPWQARLYRFDEQKTSDLQNIQYQIVNYWQSKERIPVALSELNDPISGFVIPADAQTGAPYEYTATGKTAFKLCATFNAETQSYASASRTYAAVAPVEMGVKGSPLSDNWWHQAGHQCFDRTIDPERYPPYSKQKTQ